MSKPMTSARSPSRGASAGPRKYPFPLRYTVDQGRRGFYRNHSCPYPEESDKAREWIRGFNLAYYDNQLKLTQGV